ncbi:hypothetical protein [Nocardia sp. NPDC024068]
MLGSLIRGGRRLRRGNRGHRIRRAG